jgi:hypothetical protein
VLAVSTAGWIGVGIGGWTLLLLLFMLFINWRKRGYDP